DDVSVSVRADLPSNWTPASTPCIVVSVDGTQQVDSPVSITSVVRLVAWSDSPTEANDLAMLAAGHMETATEFTARIATGPVAASDPSHGNARLCAVTLRTRIRSVPVDLDES